MQLVEKKKQEEAAEKEQQAYGEKNMVVYLWNNFS